MVEQFSNHIERHQLCKTTDKILLAISGGMDSMVMLDLFLKTGFSVSVAHCNFQLRGQEADEDEAFVREYCHTTGIPFYSRRFDTARYAENNSLSIQMAARELRYSFFKELITREGYALVATAHHLNDSLETFLLQLVKGTSFSPSGIAVRNKHIIRPLLFATREQIELFAAENNIAWREDRSNQTDDYQRNFLRHHVIPKLMEINPSLEETFSRSVDRQRSMQAFLNRSIEQEKLKYVREIQGVIHVSLDSLTEYVLYEIVKPYGFNADQCSDVLKARMPGKQFFSATHRLTLDRNHLLIDKQPDIENFSMVVPGNERQIAGRYGTLMLHEVEPPTVFPDDPTIALIDRATVRFPLEWRVWRNGDHFVPLGMRHSKKLSDFLIDLKVPMPLKDRVTVLLSNGEIIWVVGYRINDRVKITANTRQVLRLEFDQNPS